MGRDLKDLDPAIQHKAGSFIAELKQRGIAHAIIETRRSQVVQLAYWLQGRAEYGTINAVRVAAGLRAIERAEAARIITRADGVQVLSEHQKGRALDVAPILPATGTVLWDTVRYTAQWKAIIEVAKRNGFTCGADWPPLSPVTGLGWDPPHLEA